MTCGSRNSRPTRPWLLLDVPLFFLPCIDDEFKFGAVAFHFRHRRALVEQRAGRTGHDAFAARRAGLGIAPRLVEIADDVGPGAAAGDVLGASAFDVPANPHTTGAENAPVMVHAEAQMGVVHPPLRKAIIVTHVVHALAAGERLQFAM